MGANTAQPTQLLNLARPSPTSACDCRHLGFLVRVREHASALSVAVCVLLLAQLGLAASIGVRPVRDVPWLRIATFVLACGVAAVRRSL